MALSVRQHGFIKIIAGGLTCALLWYGIYQKGGFGDSRGGTFQIIALGAPGAVVLIGLRSGLGHTFVET